MPFDEPGPALNNYAGEVTQAKVLFPVESPPQLTPTSAHRGPRSSTSHRQSTYASSGASQSDGKRARPKERESRPKHWPMGLAPPLATSPYYEPASGMVSDVWDAFSINSVAWNWSNSMEFLEPIIYVCPPLPSAFRSRPEAVQGLGQNGAMQTNLHAGMSANKCLKVFWRTCSIPCYRRSLLTDRTSHLHQHAGRSLFLGSGGSIFTM